MWLLKLLAKLFSMLVGAVLGTLMALFIYNPVTCFIGALDVSLWQRYGIIANLFRILMSPIVFPVVALFRHFTTGGARGFKHGFVAALGVVPTAWNRSPYYASEILVPWIFAALIGLWIGIPFVLLATGVISQLPTIVTTINTAFFSLINLPLIPVIVGSALAIVSATILYELMQLDSYFSNRFKPREKEFQRQYIVAPEDEYRAKQIVGMTPSLRESFFGLPPALDELNLVPFQAYLTGKRDIHLPLTKLSGTSPEIAARLHRIQPQSIVEMNVICNSDDPEDRFSLFNSIFSSMSSYTHLRRVTFTGLTEQNKEIYRRGASHFCFVLSSCLSSKEYNLPEIPEIEYVDFSLLPLKSDDLEYLNLSVGRQTLRTLCFRFAPGTDLSAYPHLAQAAQHPIPPPLDESVFAVPKVADRNPSSVEEQPNKILLFLDPLFKPVMRVLNTALGTLLGAVMGVLSALFIYNPVTCFIGALDLSHWKRYRIQHGLILGALINSFRIAISPFVFPIIALLDQFKDGAVMGWKEGLPGAISVLPRAFEHAPYYPSEILLPWLVAGAAVLFLGTLATVIGAGVIAGSLMTLPSLGIAALIGGLLIGAYQVLQWKNVCESYQKRWKNFPAYGFDWIFIEDNPSVKPSASEITQVQAPSETPKGHYEHKETPTTYGEFFALPPRLDCKIEWPNEVARVAEYWMP